MKFWNLERVQTSDIDFKLGNNVHSMHETFDENNRLIPGVVQIFMFNAELGVKERIIAYDVKKMCWREREK